MTERLGEQPEYTDNAFTKVGFEQSRSSNVLSRADVSVIGCPAVTYPDGYA